MALPLEGLKVLELTMFAYGPHTGVLLAEMGADVIKIERTAGGDPARGVSSLKLVPVTDPNYAFEDDNHSKRCIALDLSKDEGKEVAYKLIADQDVFLTNMQYTTIRKLGMDYEMLSKINPKLIYAFASGWGMKGQLKDAPAFDYVVWARSGLMQALSEPNGAPVSNTPAFGDHVAAVTLAFGIVTALLHRQKTGEGQMVEASIFGSLISAASMGVAACLATGQDLVKMPRTSAGNPLWNYYKCKDGKWIQLAMMQTDLVWHEFCQKVGIGGIEKDPRFIDHEKRCSNNVTLISIIDEAFNGKTREEWEKLLNGSNIIWGVVQEFLDVTKDLQAWDNEIFVTFNHPRVGPFKMCGVPVHLSKTPGMIRTAAPELGQHTEEILLDAGYTWEDIARFKNLNVIL